MACYGEMARSLVLGRELWLLIFDDSSSWKISLRQPLHISRILQSSWIILWLLKSYWKRNRKRPLHLLSKRRNDSGKFGSRYWETAFPSKSSEKQTIRFYSLATSHEKTWVQGQRTLFLCDSRKGTIQNGFTSVQTGNILWSVGRIATLGDTNQLLQGCKCH